MQSVVKRGGMWLAREESIKTSIGGARHPALELSVSGLPGWVSVYVPGPPVDLRVRVWACRGVEVFFRPPIPVPSPLERAD